MSRLALARARAAEIKEIAGTIYGIATIFEDDSSREELEDQPAALGRSEKGVLNTAVKHLAIRADLLAEAIEEDAQ